METTTPLVIDYDWAALALIGFGLLVVVAIMGVLALAIVRRWRGKA